MTIKQTSQFLPEEHRVISEWLKVEPVEEIPADLDSETALKNLGLDNDEVSIHSNIDYAVAAILLERVQGRLPQWASVKDDSVTFGRELRDKGAERVIEMTPRNLFTLNWADSGPGFSWPEDYNVTFVPVYDVFIVTGSVDSTDIYGVTDFALGHFPKGEDLLAASGEIIFQEWKELVSSYDQHRWAYLFGEGLMNTAAAESLADRLWDPDGEPLPEREIADGAD
jgi:hypothetical protein